MRSVVALALACAVVTSVAAAEPGPTVLGKFSTTYARDDEHKTRAFNVELAAEVIDGRVIPAGATFSFNDAVGERTAAFGFEKSAVIRDRMMAEGTGGGTCQVASTLYAAALLAGLDVVARAPHTRPSAYIRMGLDATVAFPKIDLKLANPTSVPVVLHAKGGKGRAGTLEVWIEARGVKAPEVALSSEIVERLPQGRVVKHVRGRPAGELRLTAFGIPGYRVRRVREWRRADGSVQRDVRIDLYPPTPEILETAPSFDEEDLPETKIVIDPAAVRPVLVQLRPSMRVEWGSGSGIIASDEP
jgi:vancomycin resistance protein YoaR